MQLKLKRSQHETGLVFKHPVYCVDILAEFTPEEQAVIKRQKLGSTVLLSIHGLNSGFKDTETGEFLKKEKGIVFITAASIAKGHQLQHKDLATLHGAENKLQQACQALQTRLKASTLYSGEETVIDFGGAEPEVVARASPLADDA